MSEIMTAIHLPGLDLGDGGFAEWGIVPVTEMISAHRARAQKAKATAEAILAANDADFLIETYRGPYVQRDRKIIQPGRATPSLGGEGV